MSAAAHPERAGLLRNLAWLTGANLLIKPLWFLFITAACMRVLGAADYGTLVAAMALVGMTVMVTEFGTGEYVTREVARSPATASDLFSNLLAGRVAGGALAFAAALGIGLALGYRGTELAALLAAGTYTLTYRLAELARALYRAYEVLRYEAFSLFAERVLVIAFGLTGLLLTRSAAGALGGMTVGAALSLLTNLAWIHRRLAPLHVGYVSRPALRAAYTAAIPLGVFGVAATLLNQAGPVVIEALQGNEAAGQYGAGFRLVEMMMLLPTMVCAAALPRLSALYGTGDLAGYRRVLRLSALGLGVGSVAVTLLVTGLAPTIVAFLAPPSMTDGSFEAAGPLLRLLSWAYPPMALATLLCYALIAANKQRAVALSVSAAALANLAFALPLVPQFGAEAAALSLIACQAGVAVACSWSLYRAVLAAPRSPRPAEDRPLEASLADD